jgi:hypothetical protein
VKTKNITIRVGPETLAALTKMQTTYTADLLGIEISITAIAADLMINGLKSSPMAQRLKIKVPTYAGD